MTKYYKTYRGLAEALTEAGFSISAAALHKAHDVGRIKAGLYSSDNGEPIWTDDDFIHIVSVLGVTRRRRRQ